MNEFWISFFLLHFHYNANIKHPSGSHQCSKVPHQLLHIHTGVSAKCQRLKKCSWFDRMPSGQSKEHRSVPFFLVQVIYISIQARPNRVAIIIHIGRKQRHGPMCTYQYTVLFSSSLLDSAISTPAQIRSTGTQIGEQACTWDLLPKATFFSWFSNSKWSCYSSLQRTPGSSGVL